MTCDTINARCASVNLSTIRPNAGSPGGDEPSANSAAPAGYIVYAIEELASGRHYVGLTRRSLDERIASHVAQARRDRRVREGGLMAALRLMRALGQSFAQCFSARILGRADTADEARDLERRWIELLDCRTPHGLNGMPGGSSVGGVHNAQRLSVRRRDGAVETYPSIQAAIAACNARRGVAGQPLLEPGTVYASLAGGWTAEEALGLEPRQDPRALRAAFAFGNKVYTTLQAASDATGMLPATLRSRLQRSKHAGAACVPQIGRDRRARGPGGRTPLNICWPETGEALTASEFAARTGSPKATIMHRLRRIRSVIVDGEQLPSEAVRAFLTMPAGGKRAAARALDRVLSQATRPVAELSPDVLRE